MSDRPAPLAPPNKALPTFETPEDRNERHRAFMDRANAATSGADCVVHPLRHHRRRDPIQRMSRVLQDYARGGTQIVKFPILPERWQTASPLNLSDPTLYDEPFRAFDVYLAPIISRVRYAYPNYSEEIAWYAEAMRVRRELIEAGGQWE